ncbi:MULTISPECIES: DNA methyltransferase [Mogibacterium]|jgi:type III restriction/modification enzyme, methylase subunit|uniref:DNA methyltransferase n=1 Tax=Mogibacterium TaxID=86331 RepID=UPI00257A61C6|nr:MULTISPECIES: site-specific DNA-methyltransferase [Mogibacterium]
MNNNIFEIVEEVLKTNSKYISDDGKLLKAMVYSDVMTMDKELLSLLLSNEKIKERFFENVNGTLVFDKQGFAWFIESKEFLPDSYTRYTNKIGLTNGGDFISKSNDVVLDFPYKDCVLEGGQDKEDQKRKEIFYNETIASDEISKMLAPKVFTNAKRYTKDGVEENITFDENDNLIIKGNNLIALSSILKRYEGKVKCIYIDPPYYFINNKSADTFGYNSNFKLSTWLLFMKNRLYIAKSLLRTDGSIWVNVGADGQHYLKTMMDDIFGYDCFVSDISWQKTYSPRNDSQGISSEVESILVYSKSPNWMPKKLPRTEKMNSVYKNPDNDHTLWRTSDAFAPEAITHQGMVYAIQHPITGEMLYPYNGAHWPLEQNTMLEEMRKWANYKLEQLNDDDKRAAVCGIPKDAVRKNIPAIVLDESLKSAKEKSLAIIERGQWPKFFFTKNGFGGIARKTYLDDSKGKVVTNFWPFDEAGHTDEAKKEITSIFNDKVFSTPKPEKLIYQILYVASNEGDLVLDFHLGSGTTCAVAHKMKRGYIGVEQMDYIESISVNRLRYVIKNNDTEYSWDGGGSFVYCELKENASTLIEKIQAASEETINEIKNEIYSDERIVPYITRKELKKADEEFNSLELQDKINALISLVDKNKLYVNYSDMDDESYDISESDKAFTKSFYVEV